MAASASFLEGPPRFDLGERDGRYRAVRRRMVEAGLAALIVPHATGDWDNLQPDTRYLTLVGGAGAATALVFPLEGDPIVAVREPRRAEWWRRAQDWVADVRFPPDLDWARFFVEGLRDLGVSRERVGVVGLDGVVREPGGVVPYRVFERIRAECPEIDFVSATALMCGVRKTKSRAEVAMLRRAQACADAITDGLGRVRPGDWLHHVFADMTAAAMREGGESPAMYLLGCGETMWQTQLAPEFRQVTERDILLVEAEPKFFGYAAQAVRTVPMRALTDVERRLLDASRACFDALIDAMRPGRSYRDLFPIWHAAASAGGCRPGRSLGHATGLGQDRPWTTTSGLLGGGDLPIEDGDCFVLKPWVSTADDSVSGRVGDVVTVTADGTFRLSRHGLA